MPRPLLAKLSRPSPSQVLARQEFVAPPPEQPAIEFPALSAPRAIPAKYHSQELPSRARPDKSRHHKTECQNQRNPIVRSAKPHQRVRGKGESDKASSHLKISVKKRVGDVRRISKDPEQGKIRRTGYRPYKDETKAMQKSPNIARTAHHFPLKTNFCP